MRVSKVVSFVIALCVGLPALAHAQATLAGVVRDPSGAVLPGVTVEAGSPVLIEKTRTGVTDGTGQFRFESLPPGTYTVTFTLSGFSTVKRQAVDVSGAGVITINTELHVGAVSETVTVAGETPIVDVQSARHQQVLDDRVVSEIPATRGYNAILAAIPSVTGGSLDVDLSPTMRIFTSHGGRGNEGHVQVGGAPPALISDGQEGPEGARRLQPSEVSEPLIRGSSLPFQLWPAPISWIRQWPPGICLLGQADRKLTSQARTFYHPKDLVVQTH